MFTDYQVRREIKANDYYLKYLSDHFNKRTILLEHRGNTHQVIEQLKKISLEEQSGKIIAYVRDIDKPCFEQQDFIQEGQIQGYFRGEDAHCFSYFINPERMHSSRIGQEDIILRDTILAPSAQQEFLHAARFYIRNTTADDIEKLARFMGEYFETYPTPVHDPKYIKKVIREGTLFKIVLHQEEIAAVASADCNQTLLNAEITDCLTHPAFRGNGLAVQLIAALEKDLQALGYMTLFSLARAISPGINRALKYNEYHFSGRLINNCNIMGSTEDMNIWVKNIQVNQGNGRISRGLSRGRFY